MKAPLVETASITPRILRRAGAAAYLGMSETKLRELVAQGLVPTVRIPGSRMLMFDRVELDRWIERCAERERVVRVIR